MHVRNIFLENEEFRRPFFFQPKNRIVHVKIAEN